MMRRLLVVLCLMLAGSAGAQYQTPELKALLSRLQSMSHGTYTEREWRDVITQLDDFAQRAEREDAYNEVVQARSIKAMVLSDMRRDYTGALRVLDEALQKYGTHKLPEVKRLYVQKAEIYGKMGDEEGARRTIEAFRNSPHFDPMEYPYVVGEGRNTPLTLVRPSARGADSVSVTAMEVARGRARFAPGNLFPDFKLTDHLGRPVNLQDLRGKVVLVDLWLQGWTPWRRDLAYQISTYRRYAGAGFQVVGIALDRDVASAQAFAAANALPWTLVYGDTSLARQLGIFGEAANFLIDRNGMIVGQNLRGAELALGVQKALGVK